VCPGGHPRVAFDRHAFPSDSARRAKIPRDSGRPSSSMTELEIPTSDKAALSAREKRDAQRAQLRPLANLRPELVDDEGYSPDELEAMMEMYNGTMASIDEGEIVKAHVLEIRDNMVVLDIGFK